MHLPKRNLLCVGLGLLLYQLIEEVVALPSHLTRRDVVTFGVPATGATFTLDTPLNVSFHVVRDVQTPPFDVLQPLLFVLHSLDLSPAVFPPAVVHVAPAGVPENTLTIDFPLAFNLSGLYILTAFTTTTPIDDSLTGTPFADFTAETTNVADTTFTVNVGGQEPAPAATTNESTIETASTATQADFVTLTIIVSVPATFTTTEPGVLGNDSATTTPNTSDPLSTLADVPSTTTLPTTESSSSSPSADQTVSTSAPSSMDIPCPPVVTSTDTVTETTFTLIEPTTAFTVGLAPTSTEAAVVTTSFPSKRELLRARSPLV